MVMGKEYTPTEQEENELDYLAEILVEVYLESKDYKQYPWLNSETRWRKESIKPIKNSDIRV
jgi:hypothetical protein